MGHQKQSRRRFLRALTTGVPAALEKAGDNVNDPLFQKYSRKKAAPRHYSPEEVSLKIGTEDADSVIRVGNVTSGLQPYTGAWTEWEVLHLLRRVNFGYKQSWVAQLLALTPSAAVDAVLNIDTNPPAPPVNWYQNVNATSADENGLPLGADWTNSFFTTGSIGQTSNTYRLDSLRRWSFGLTLNGDISIREKMVWFWYHFMPVDFAFITQSSNSFVGTNSARILYRYLKLFRDQAFGNFKSLVRAVSVEPAMMFYLNNQANSAAAPDENFARELMELFTLGKNEDPDPDKNYTQADVIAAARVLTGWRVQNLNTATPVTNFLPNSHSTGNKQFSSFFNNTVITYGAGAAGANELDALIDMIFAKSTVVSQYICRRLYRYFIYYDIDANVEANVIVPLAQTFVASNWNIKPVLEQLFKSQHFFDVANRGVYIKSPFDLVAGVLNSFAVNTTDAAIERQYRIWSSYNDGYSNSMEQRMGSIPDVSGWNAFYQVPAYHQYWINSNAVQKRFAFVRDLFNGHSVSGVASRTFKIDVVAFAQAFGNPVARDPNALTAICIKFLLPVDLSDIKKEAMKASTLLSGQTNDVYWQTAWDNFTASPTTANRNVVEPRLKNLLSGICQLAEYQLM